MTFTLVFFAVLLAGGAVFIFRPIWHSRRVRSRAAVEDEQERVLREKRQALLLLRDLDFDYQTGKILEADYTSDRAEAEERAIQLLRRLDHFGQPGEQEGARDVRS